MKSDKPNLKQRIINRFGPTWRKFFLRFTWSALPFLFVAHLSTDLKSSIDGQSPQFLNYLWIPLSAVAALWVASSTSAAIASIETPKRKEVLTSLAREAFLAGYRLLSISVVVYAVLHQPLGWNLWALYKLLYLPSVIGSIIALFLAYKHVMNVVRYAEEYSRDEQY